MGAGGGERGHTVAEAGVPGVRSRGPVELPQTVIFFLCGWNIEASLSPDKQKIPLQAFWDSAPRCQGHSSYPLLLKD